MSIKMRIFALALMVASFALMKPVNSFASRQPVYICNNNFTECMSDSGADDPALYIASCENESCGTGVCTPAECEANLAADKAFCYNELNQCLSGVPGVPGFPSE